MKQKLLILLTLLTFCTAVSSAQRNYPVRATVQYTPPYSLFLGDYATPKLIITLTGQDLLDANCPYKLSISLECQNVKVTTKPSYSPTPLYINGGQTIVLTGADLARYFDIQNLDFHGITAAKYLQDGQLPEGFYRMNVKVIHYHENRVISNTAFTMFNARMGKPPVLTLPKDKSLIPPNQQVMPIVFSWTPKTVGSYQYRFELWECAVPGIPVQTVVSTIRPIYTQTTFSPMLTLHTANLNMKPGMEYAWRVTVEDPHNQQKFANQGQSEIFTFTYKRKPEPVTGLRFSNRGLKITWTWDMDPAHTKYYFEYYDPQTGRTIDPVACDYAEFVRNMPQTGYHLKARVRAECYGDPTLLSDYTPYLDTNLEPIPVPEYECGKVFPDREITNLELKHTFAPGEIVESKNGDTRYEIIFSEEKNGYLSGQFFMIMDCWGGAKIRCEFSKTQINTDNIVLKTIFHSVTDSTLYIKPETIRKEVEQAFFDAATVLTDFSIKDTVKLDKPYTYLYVNPSGKVVAVSVNNNGKTEEKTTEISATNLKENTLIQGKNGEELVLTKKGQVMGKDEFNATGGNSVLLKEYHRKSDSLAQWQINFSKYDAQTYAFDHIGSGNHGIFSSSEYYPQVGSYDFRYKSVECGKNDKVIVEFDTYREKDSVVFKDKYGVTYPIKDRILTFTGVNQADTNFIYAYRGDQKIGKLFLNTYQQKTYKVVFVRVNGAAKKLNAKEITKYLNKVYNQCSVSFEDSIDNISIGNLTSFSHGGSGVLTVYNNDQKTVLNAYDKRMKDGVYYLFFVDEVKDKKDGSGTSVSGYMPRGYNAGFIYDGGSERTIAHELGHGIAGLEHVFENSNNSGKTANLMDYANVEELWHFQWDQIQDPNRVWMKWNKAEEEGENVEGVEQLNPLISFKIKGNKTKEYEYENGGLFATMYTEDEITIEIQNKGDKDLEIEEIKWENGSKKGKSDVHIDKDNKQVVLKLNQKNLGNIGEKSKLSVLDKSGQIIALLDFQTYYPPYIEFSVNDKTYNGEFLFDDSFNHISKVSLDNPTEYFKQYVHINVGNKNIDYYAPVLGMQLNQIADILLNFKEFDGLAKQDKNFKIVITSDNPSIKINKDPSFEINSSNIEELYKNGAINIQFTKTLQSRENNKLPQNGVLLYAEIPSLNKKIGLIECYCTEMIKKQIDLISVRFDSKSSYPTVNVSELKKYLNEHAFNQLFIDLDISLFEWNLDKDLYLNNPVYLRLDDKEKKKFKEEYCLTENSLANMKDDDVYNKLSEFHNPFSTFLQIQQDLALKAKDNEKVSKILSLRQECFQYNQKQTENGSGELFFLTKIQKIQGANRYVGGFHSTGMNGGALYTTTESFDKRYDQFAHEFGHWVGLPHAFRKQPDKSEEEKNGTAVAFIVKLMKDTKNNYMDYDITRKSWTKLQLINVK